MTFEEAKQKVAEIHLLETVAFMNNTSDKFKIIELYNEAAELWQSENLKRISELEAGLKELLDANPRGVDKFITEQAKQLLK